MEQDLISIIVPIFNSEKYLRKCIESIINQTYANLEIILVDDGSSDDSLNICNEYAMKYKNIKVISNINQGVSEARNKGLKKAKGNFIGFVDSDDTIHPQMYEILMKVLKTNNADISCCSFYINCENNYKIREDIINVVYSFNNEESINLLYGDIALEMSVLWNKLYKKYLFENIEFPRNRIHEDQSVLYKLLYKSNKFVYINEKLYFYIKRENSIMNKTFNKERFYIFDAYRERTEFFKSNNLEELYTISINHYLKRFIEHYLEYSNINYDDINNLKELYYDKYYKKYSCSLNNRIILKLKYRFFYNNPKIYIFIYKFNYKLKNKLLNIHNRLLIRYIEKGI